MPVQQARGAFRLDVNQPGLRRRGPVLSADASSAPTCSLAAFGGDGSVRVLPAGDLPIAGAARALPARGRRAVGVNTARRPTARGIERRCAAGGFWTVVGVFFVAGVLLSFTPCVLPMLPILSSIIVGQARRGVARPRRSRSRRAIRSAWRWSTPRSASPPAWPAKGSRRACRTPWVLALFALALVALSLSMFGVYELRLPSA